MGGSISGLKQCYAKAMSEPKVLSGTKERYGAGSYQVERRAAALCAKSNGTEAIDTYLAVVSDPSMLTASRTLGAYYLEQSAFIAAGGDAGSGEYK